MLATCEGVFFLYLYLFYSVNERAVRNSFASCAIPIMLIIFKACCVAQIFLEIILSTPILIGTPWNAISYISLICPARYGKCFIFTCYLTTTFLSQRPSGSIHYSFCTQIWYQRAFHITREYYLLILECWRWRMLLPALFTRGNISYIIFSVFLGLLYYY